MFFVPNYLHLRQEKYHKICQISDYIFTKVHFLHLNAHYEDNFFKNTDYNYFFTITSAIFPPENYT